MILGCVACPPNTYYRPETMYIYNGSSYCDHCLRLKQKALHDLPQTVAQNYQSEGVVDVDPRTNA